VRPFMIPCEFGSVRVPFPLYVGEPVFDAHPMEQQAAWLERERGGLVPLDVMDSFAKLREIAAENNVSFEELVVYAMDEASKQAPDEEQPEAPQA